MTDARFRQCARLKRKVEFRHVFGQAAKSADGYFTVLARPNGLGFPRLGLVIGRKSAGSAVARNRIKRVVRESFRHHQQELGGLDWVVIGRENLSSYDNAIFFESLKRHWLKLRKQCANS